MFLALTPPGEGMDANTTIFMCVFWVCFAAIIITLIKSKR